MPAAAGRPRGPVAARARRPAGADAARRAPGRHRAGAPADHRTGPSDVHVRARGGLRVDGFPDQGRDLRASRLQRGIRSGPGAGRVDASPRRAAAAVPARSAVAVRPQQRGGRRARLPGHGTVVGDVPADTHPRSAGDEGHRLPRACRQDRPTAAAARARPADRRVPRVGRGGRRKVQRASRVPGRRRRAGLDRRRLPRVLPDAARPRDARK
ncbi:hypothetical protein D3C74_353770 [compost metagenome]